MINRDYLVFSYLAVLIFWWSYFAAYLVFSFSLISFLALIFFYGATFGLLLCLTYFALSWKLDSKFIVYGSALWLPAVILFLACLYGWLGEIKREMIKTWKVVKDEDCVGDFDSGYLFDPFDASYIY